MISSSNARKRIGATALADHRRLPGSVSVQNKGVYIANYSISGMFSLL